MSILLTNDDGIGAPSIRQLKETLSPVAECIVVAPETQKSASAHAISIVHDVEVKKYYHGKTFFGYQVKGTPADCVKLALCEIMEEPPELIIAGINVGPNTGISVYYSGTVAAAREGTIVGIPSIAVSMCSFEYNDFTFANTLVKDIAMHIGQKGLPPSVTLNINIPPLPRNEIKGIKVTKQAHSRFVERFVKTSDKNDVMSFSLTGEIEVVDTDSNNDEQAVKEGYVSITPLRLDLTDLSAIKEIERYIKCITV